MGNDYLQRSLLLSKQSDFKLKRSIEGDINVFRIDNEIMFVLDWQRISLIIYIHLLLYLSQIKSNIHTRYLLLKRLQLYVSSVDTLRYVLA
jgi:hypothetical protein